MLLKHLSLRNYRNFADSTFEINPSLTVVAGENARGKTNLLESIYFAVHGYGFRESKEEELVTWGKSQAIVESIWINSAEMTFQIMLSERESGVGKRFFVNKTEKRHSQYLEYLSKAVLFAPEHIEIVDEGPDKRRDYFNRLLSVIDIEYKKKLQNYEHALRKRNKILEFHKDAATLKKELLFWDDYLIQHADYITQKRLEYMRFLNDNNVLHDRVFHIAYMANKFNRERLDLSFEKERLIRKTLIGPQKDDFIITLESDNKKNLHLYGSRSEQRMSVFWLKLNEIKYLEKIFQKKPILLLDDVFSEFDSKNKQFILELIGDYQTVITTTEPEVVELSGLDKLMIKFS